MPTYDYACDACGHTLEIFQGINDPIKKKCPECGKNKLRRLIGTGAGIIFKGSGFYETDYRSDGYSKDKKADSEKKSEKKAESKSETKSESKPKADSSKPKKETKKD